MMLDIEALDPAISSVEQGRQLQPAVEVCLVLILSFDVKPPLPVN
jgi:hypothetical protein